MAPLPVPPTPIGPCTPGGRPPRPGARRPSGRLAAALAVGALAVACGPAGDPEAQPEVLTSLLGRAPMERTATDDVVVPIDLDQWGARDGGGWQGHTRRYGQEVEPAVIIQGDEAGLRLATIGPTDRDLTLRVHGQGGGLSLQLVLNGVVLETFALGEGLQDLTVEAPAPFWQEGPNDLVLRPTGVDGAPAPERVAVARVELTPAEVIAPAEGGLAFASGTAATWPVELRGSGVLDVEARSDAAGTAVLDVATMDPATGARTPLERRELVVDPAAGPALGRVHLPDPAGAVLVASLSWQAADGKGQLLVERLELFEEQPLERPSVLFVSIDTLAAPNLSAYGYERPTTPRLEAFAAESVLFEVARANAPWTIPSYASQFTGLYARSNKTRDVDTSQPLAAWQRFHIAQGRWTLPEMLQAAGYRTGAFVDNLWLARVPGFAQGFEVYDPEAALLDHRHQDGGMHLVLPRTLDFLERHRGEPTFAFAQIVDVHGPYLPNEPWKGTFNEQLTDDDLTSLPVVRTSPTAFGGIPDVVAAGRFGDELPEHYHPEVFQADYDEKILEMDAAFGAFVDDLKARGLYDDLLIIFSADHGESMVDHDFNFRHGIVYDSAIHVPLVIKLPGQEHAGRRVTTPVQLVDLYPTLADVLGVAEGRDFLHGRSLMPLVEGAVVEDVPLMSQADILEHCTVSVGKWKLLVAVPEKTAIDTILTSPKFQRQLHARVPDLFEATLGGPPPIAPDVVIDTLAEIKATDRKRNWALTKQVRALEPLVELYDTVADPDELVDLSDEFPEVAAELMDHLVAERKKAEDMYLADESAEVKVTPEMLEELRRLGYLGDE